MPGQLRHTTPSPPFLRKTKRCKEPRHAYLKANARNYYGIGDTSSPFFKLRRLGQETQHLMRFLPHFHDVRNLVEQRENPV